MTITPTTPHVTSPACVHALHGETMGTSWSVKLVASAQVDLHLLHDGIQRILDRIVSQMSTWESDSDISRFNRSPAGSWHALPEEFFTVLSCAVQIARESGGAYDPTVGPLVAAWGFGAALKPMRIPDPKSLADARSRVGWHRLELRQTMRTALQAGGVALDLSAIAKGFGVDAVVAHLRGQRISAALVEVGGELRGYGSKPDGARWAVLVETSAEGSDGAEPCVMVLDDVAVATSGDHWHAFEQDGVSYSHSLDPRSGRPVPQATMAVTVVAADAMQADAWATALTVMGAEDGLSYAQGSRLAARFVTRTRDGLRITMSDAFRDRLPA